MHRRSLKERDAFPTSTDEYAQQVERLLQLRRADLDEAWGKLEEGWEAINERMARSGLAPRADEEDVVKLNIGGQKFSACWHILAEAEGFKDSTLGALLEGAWGEGRVPRDQDGLIVLDESPVCVKLIIVQTMLRANGLASSSSAAEGSLARSAVAVDEVPCLMYTARVMGLPGSVLTHHPKYVNMDGGSTILEPFEIAPFGAVVRTWVGGSTEQMTLIYRAMRDGFGSKAFTARCNASSPNTVSLIRVRSGTGNDDDSVVGGYSASPWGVQSRIITSAEDLFVFMLKDGSATRKVSSTPIKWHTLTTGRVPVSRSDGPSFGLGDLDTIFDEMSGGCTIQTEEVDFPIGSSPSFLASNGKIIVDIEVCRYSTPSPTMTTPAPSTTKYDGDVLTDTGAHDIRSFGESIASSLMQERMVLDRAVREMEVAGATVSAAVGALETVYGPSVAAGEQDAVVELNVRGTRMTTLRSTLQACPRSALATMFDAESWPVTDKDKDEHGRRLIDCSPTCFSKILDVLRVRKRASWSRGGTPDTMQEECSRHVLPGGVLIKEASVEAFGEAVNLYFPGCESFIIDLVQCV